ncbi:sacsin N-terminal ATP-binding-like domain-containing protein [Georgenia daeguensis]|uniref:ATP-binding protein n=1 Tax=Georgenia daeguensis TaxID=908355 RepID=A0ABP8ESQ5_9MICO
MSAPVGADFFGTAGLRDAALTTWRRDPSRLRQDANLEEDHARGYYRDRVVVELAQNAADAAAAAGLRGRLLLRLTATPDGAELLAANTGAPLTADGVAALASMRASAKRSGGQVGRFGVGFAAVRSVSDEITVATRTADGVAGVTFSLARTAALLAQAAADHPALAAEVARRHGDLPALRLPFPAGAPAVPAGCTTAVTLRLRGPRETDAVRASLAELDDVVLLALPSLGEIVVETDDAPPRRLADVRDRWYSAHASGGLDPALLAGRPVEERERTGWFVTWAVPRPGTPGTPGDAAQGGHASAGATGLGTVHAPTPTDEPCTVPAVLIGSFPLDPSRRHVAPGPLTDRLVQLAGAHYGSLADLLAGARGRHPLGRPHVLSLVPTGLPAGALDAALHEAALEGLRRTPLLRETGTENLLRAGAAQALLGPAGQDEHLLAALAPMVGGLVHVPPEHTAAARVLGVALRDLADVVDSLPTGGHPPGRWRDVYAALAPYAAAHREALAGLPVPLHDGRTARGARGLLLPTAGLGGLPIDLPGLRIVHPSAAHPVLATLGATEADAVTLLEQPEVRAAAEDVEDGAPVPAAVAAVLALAQAAVADRGEDAELPGWLADLPLPGEDGEQHPADDLVVPGSWAAGVLDALVPVRADVVDRWGAATLRAVGVRTDLVTTVVRDVVAEPGEDDVRLDGWGDYLAHLAEVLGAGAFVGDVTAVADLDAVADEAWPRALARLAEDRDARAALLTEVRASAGGTGTAPSYTAWWLREELGAPFAHPRGAGATPFLPPAPDGTEALDDAVLAAVGAVRDLADLDAGAWDAYLDQWPDDGALAMPDALALWRALARAAADGVRLAPPDAVPALVEGSAQMVPAEQVVVAAPVWAQVRAVLPAPSHLVGKVADLLDLDAAGGVVPDAADARAVATPAEVLAVLPGAPATWFECEQLTVDGVDVNWWATAGSAWATTTAGLARALAHAAGRWAARHDVEAVLLDPGALEEVLAEAAGE